MNTTDTNPTRWDDEDLFGIVIPRHASQVALSMSRSQAEPTVLAGPTFMALCIEHAARTAWRNRSRVR